MSTLRTDYLESLDETFNIAVKDLGPGTATSSKSVKDLLEIVTPVAYQVLLKGYFTGSTKGSGTFCWDGAKAKSQHDGGRVISPTVPWNGAKNTLLNFLNGVGETDPSGFGCWVRVFDGPVEFEMFGIEGVGDEGALMNKVITIGYTEGLDVEGHGAYTTSVELTLPNVRVPSAPVFRDFNKTKLYINQLTFIGTSGNAISAGSPVASVYVRRLIGPGTDVGITSGFYCTGLGDANHRVDWCGGFTNGINFDFAYSNTITVGWIEDCIRGVRINGNANKVWGGHIGGSYVTAAISPTSCEVGVAILEGSAANEIHANVEYCRRSNTSIGIQDFGTGTQYVGYTESSHSYNIYAAGKNGYYKVLAGGTNVITEPSGYFAGDSNYIEFMTQVDYFNELVDGGNATLAFQTPQAFGGTGNGILKGPRGLDTFLINTTDNRNLIVNSSLLTGTGWATSALGSANWASVTRVTSPTALPERGMPITTRCTFPALAGDTDIYRISQGGFTLPQGPLSFGTFIKCESGSIDVMVRVVTGTRQSRHVVRLTPTSGFLRIGSDVTNSIGVVGTGVYELSFRTSVGAVIEIGGCYLNTNFKTIFPTINGATAKIPITGSEIDGTTFYNGVNVNGTVRRNCANVITSGVTLDSTTITDSLYIVSAGTYNILLSPALDGTEITLKRDGTVATVNILPSLSFVDGSGAAIPFSTPYAVKKFIFTTTYGWLTL